MMSIVYGPKWPFYSCLDYIALFGTGICRFFYLGRSARGERQVGRGAQARQEFTGRAAGRLGRAGRARQGRVRAVQTSGLCAPVRAGWAVSCGLGALSLFFTRFRLSTVPESILGGNFL